MPSSNNVEVSFDGHTLSLSNLDKVLYPATGFTKGQIIDYYVRVAPVLLPHLHNRPITMKRYPNGVDESFFYQKQKPTHAPEWIESVPVKTSSKTIDYIVINDVASLVWVANMASIELHPFLAFGSDVLKPSKLTFDLDPGPPADIVQCCQVALQLRELFTDLSVEAFPKTSGSKGMQLEVPLNVDTDYEHTKTLARTIAQLMESRHPASIVFKMEKALRKNKVFIDWSQNDDAKTTISVYSLRARERPTVSTPVSWDEVEKGAEGEPLTFETDDVLARIESLGDLQAPVLDLKQSLPRLA